MHTHVLVLAAAWALLFCWLLLRFRRRRQPVARYRGVSGLLPAFAIGFVIVGDIVILVSSALPAWAARMTPPLLNAEAVEVRVIGEQSRGTCTIPVEMADSAARARRSSARPIRSASIARTPAAADDIGLTNILTVPVDRPIVVHLSSRDVVHGFTLFEMRVKQDATPGMTVRTWFTATRPGEWQIGCSQLCGRGHFRMKGTFTVVSAEDWERWLEKETPSG